jgi:hypothetical protein
MTGVDGPVAGRVTLEYVSSPSPHLAFPSCQRREDYALPGRRIIPVEPCLRATGRLMGS